MHPDERPEWEPPDPEPPPPPPNPDPQRKGQTSPSTGSPPPPAGVTRDPLAVMADLQVTIARMDDKLTALATLPQQIAQALSQQTAILSQQTAALPQQIAQALAGLWSKETEKPLAILAEGPPKGETTELGAPQQGEMPATPDAPPRTQEEGAIESEGTDREKGVPPNSHGSQGAPLPQHRPRSPLRVPGWLAKQSISERGDPYPRAHSNASSHNRQSSGRRTALFRKNVPKPMRGDPYPRVRIVVPSLSRRTSGKRAHPYTSSKKRRALYSRARQDAIPPVRPLQGKRADAATDWGGASSWQCSTSLVADSGRPPGFTARKSCANPVTKVGSSKARMNHKGVPRISPIVPKYMCASVESRCNTHRNMD